MLSVASSCFSRMASWKWRDQAFKDDLQLCSDLLLYMCRICHLLIARCCLLSNWLNMRRGRRRWNNGCSPVAQLDMERFWKWTNDGMNSEWLTDPRMSRLAMYRRARRSMPNRAWKWRVERRRSESLCKIDEWANEVSEWMKRVWMNWVWVDVKSKQHFDFRSTLKWHFQTNQHRFTVKPLIDRHLYLNAPSNRPPPSQDDWKLDRHGGQLEVLRYSLFIVTKRLSTITSLPVPILLTIISIQLLIRTSQLVHFCSITLIVIATSEAINSCTSLCRVQTINRPPTRTFNPFLGKATVASDQY